MNNKAPKILNDIVDALVKEGLTVSESVGGEGRGGSLIDEGNVSNFIKSHPIFGKYVVDHADALKDGKKSKTSARKVGDILIRDYNNLDIHVVNIKTTGGTSDNASSKIGFLVSFTDIPLNELPKSINWEKWFNLMMTRKTDTLRDYWFLVLNKKNMNHVIIRGAKQINNWGENPSNDLQINWEDEWEKSESNDTFDISFNKVLNGIRRCKAKMGITTAPMIYGNNPILMKQVEDHLNEIINNV